MRQKNKTLILISFGIICFFVFILPQFNNTCEDLTNTELLKVSEQECSPQCCNFTQWTPLNPELQTFAYDPNSPYVPTNFFCGRGNGKGSGCPCIKKKDYDYLTNKGGNGVNCF